jgi:alkaline phosphatase/myo-inositol-hexaphosphate 3-phosphohydrolase
MNKNLFFFCIAVALVCLSLSAAMIRNWGAVESDVATTAAADAVQPVVVTQPVPFDSDDPAIWVHPVDPAKSLIVATDKNDPGGLYVFDLNGKIIEEKTVSGLQRPNNVDIEYGLSLGGKKVDIAVTTERISHKLRIYSLPDMTPVDGGGIEVFIGETGIEYRSLMGISLYKRPSDGAIFAIVGRKNGPVDGYLWQYLLEDGGNGEVTATLVRKFGRYSGEGEIEAIAVDDELGYIYYSDEAAGIRKYYADPEAGDEELALFGTEGFTEDREGISILHTSEKEGFILVSDQQAGAFNVYRREGAPGYPHHHELIKKVHVMAVESDGSEASQVAFNQTFRHGLFVAMSDDRTFHFYRVEDIIGDLLGITGADDGGRPDEDPHDDGGCMVGKDGAKYVFFFIGDGMASPQIHATEAYLAQLAADDTDPGETKFAKLNMRGFPVYGMQTNYANNRLITSSAAAGTALACGRKTNIGVVSMDPDATRNYTTLAEAAKAKGKKVGIVSSVSLDHATPAVFYAHSWSRDNYEEIGEYLINGDFDYFAGGGFRVNKYKSETYTGLSDARRYDLIEEAAVRNGFTYADTRAEFDALDGNSGRIIAVNPYLDEDHAIPYALNRISAKGPGDDYEGSITLAEFTEKGLEMLKGGEKGFFMMVEGGKIDWACHANDARAAIEETIAFDRAIGVAIDFAQDHPDETLIVVTGDHECGGMTLGFAGTEKDTYYERLTGQTIAFDDFDSKVIAKYVAGHATLPKDIDDVMWRHIFDYFALDGACFSDDTEDDLTAYEIALLENAFDKILIVGDENVDEEHFLLYKDYNPLSVTLTHLLNRKSGLSWTSFSHTAVPVPVFAKGKGAENFEGFYDNTDVALKIATAMGVSLDN